MAVFLACAALLSGLALPMTAQNPWHGLRVALSSDKSAPDVQIRDTLPLPSPFRKDAPGFSTIPHRYSVHRGRLRRMYLAAMTHLISVMDRPAKQSHLGCLSGLDLATLPYLDLGRSYVLSSPCPYAQCETNPAQCTQQLRHVLQCTPSSVVRNLASDSRAAS